MSQPIPRRGFLREAASGGTILGLGGLSFLSSLPPISAAEARLAAGTVPLQPDMEPLVQPAGRHPSRAAAGGCRRSGGTRSQLPADFSLPCFWPECGTSSRGLRSDSSSMPSWQSTRCTRPAWRPPMRIAGWPSSGPSTISRRRRPATCRKAAGG